MAGLSITVQRGANAPPVDFTFGDDIDLTGSVIELDASWGAGSLTLRTDDPASGLSLDASAGTVTWAYTSVQTAALPISRTTPFDIWRILGASREKITAGRITCAGLGDAPPTSSAATEVPGIQGPPGKIVTVATYADFPDITEPTILVVQADEENNGGFPSWYFCDGIGAPRLFGLLEVTD